MYLQEQEVFEIQDYTTASEWERFTASIEELLHEWHLTGNEYQNVEDINIKSTDVKWQEKITVIKFSDYSLTATHHFLTYNCAEQLNISEPSRGESYDGSLPRFLVDMLDMRNDFPGKAHCLTRWFGLKEFVTLVPSISSQPITSPSKTRVVLSSLALAANNTNCQTPLFLQVGELSEKTYLGVGLGTDMRTDFEMATLKSPPPQCIHLSGLLDIFRNKVGVTMASEPVLVSIRFTYVLNDWSHTLWSQQPPDFDAALSYVGVSDLGKLPFGALSDPISELQLSTTWPSVSEYSLISSEVGNELNPSSAPIWSVRLGSSFAPPCLLSEYISEFLQICQSDSSLVNILGYDFDPLIDDEARLLTALDRLTGGSRTSHWHSREPKSPRKTHGPLGEEMLSLLLNFLFNDADAGNEEVPFPYPTSFGSRVPSWAPTVQKMPTEHPLKSVLGKIKSCDVDSFVWRLSIVLCHTIQSLGGLPAVAHLYYEVLLELRFRWDNAVLIPGVPEGAPDLASCLVNQKLQMLNCCVRHRTEREHAQLAASCNESGDEDEEFFECDEGATRETISEFSSWDKPEGRLKRFGNARLIKTGDFIYIPVTQEAAPSTEDKLEQQTGELLRLGSDSLGSCQRARLMSTSLLSDMESFKAANPGALLEDFVRWYSPRDWIEDADGDVENETQAPQGRLSNRMLIPGNLWKEVWESAKPIPARRQRRLFDETREAEKVLLEWFYALTPGKLCQELLPVVMHASVCRMAEEPVLYTLSAVKEDVVPRPAHDNSLAAQLELVAKRVARLSIHPCTISHYNSVYYQIETIERFVAKAQSLRLKLLGHTTVSPSSLLTFDSGEEDTGGEGTLPGPPSPLEALVAKMLNDSEVTLEGGSKGVQADAVKNLFATSLSGSCPEDPFEGKTEGQSPGSDGKEMERPRELGLGRPAGREYILRTHAAFPADHSRKMPHRLYAVILKNSFMMSGAITQDVVFC